MKRMVCIVLAALWLMSAGAALGQSASSSARPADSPASHSAPSKNTSSQKAPGKKYAAMSAEVITAAELAGLSAASKTLGVAHKHLHHTLNCLEGPNGRGFDGVPAIVLCKRTGERADI